jgi:hypothetical protein
MQISTGGTLRFKFQNISNVHTWSVELREDPGWGNVKYLYKKDVSKNSFEIKTWDMSFELPHTVAENQEIAFFDNLEYAINYALAILNKNK